MAADTSKMPNPLTIYMTEVKPLGIYVRPRFRTHYSLSAAKNAIMQQREYVWTGNGPGYSEYRPFKIYHLLDNEWHVVYSSDIAVKYDDLPWK